MVRDQSIMKRHVRSNHKDDNHKFVDNHVDLIYANMTETDEKDSSMFSASRRN